MTVDEAATIATNILKRELRLIATDELCEDCGDPISWRVKPGNIEHCAMLIAQAIIDGELAKGGKE